MVWFALAATVASSVLGGMQQGKQESKQARTAYKNTILQNQAALKQNKLNWLETERALLSLDAQKASLRQQTAKNLALAQRMANQQRGAVQADVAAAGIKGATAEQVLMDVGTDLRERQFENEQQYLNAMQDINMQGVQMIAGAIAGTTQMQQYTAGGLKNRGLEQGLANAAIAMAGQYAQSYYKFGARAPTTPSTRAPSQVSPGAYPQYSSQLNVSGLRYGR